ncbi:shufflon system plasmid conjugative transfer pilus tip adhesin PilV, partial [Pseudomonas sp. PCH44]|uniref:shufflon system plasmid conjugative transfer pilus tip adhesin PilV n=1 Tax=Pseudomonas sp. PCH44 TaxID=2800904 RepID=UPI0020165EE8
MGRRLVYERSDLGALVCKQERLHRRRDARGKLTSEGRTEVGEYLQLNGVATEGAGCSPNGLVGRNAAGLTLSCQSGVWS